MTTTIEEALSSEIRAKASPTAAYQQDRTWARFTTWCQEHNLDTALPVSETTMLLYLHDNYPNWSWSYCRHIVNDIRNMHARHGHEDPITDRARTYLARLRRDVGSTKEEPTDPIRVDDAATIAEKYQAPPSPTATRETTASQAILLVAYATGLPLKGSSTPGHLKAETFRVTSQCVTVTPEPNGRAFIVADRDRQPEHYEIVKRALDTDEVRPLARNNPEFEHRKARLVAAWRRLGIEVPVPLESVPTLDQGTLNKWVREADAGLEQRREISAFVLLGVIMARRAIDLCRLNHEHVKPVKSGYRLEFPITKNDPDGHNGGLVKFIAHAKDDQGPCRDACPACALKAHLDMQHDKGRTSGPLFRGYGGNGGKRLTVGGARARLKAAWRNTDLDDEARIGSRSLRVGGATSASEAGWSLSEIASELTDHNTLINAALYVRRNNPLADQATLDL